MYFVLLVPPSHALNASGHRTRTQGPAIPAILRFTAQRYVVDVGCVTEPTGYPVYATLLGVQLGQSLISRCRIIGDAARIAHPCHGRYHLREHTPPLPSSSLAQPHFPTRPPPERIPPPRRACAGAISTPTPLYSGL
ncbi:hypothetical protein LshimejAT787_0700880 [Lyophyllum shimeji]|uniref:Uncharacterized protein n=1 Tax=Lyophyllum shimeji TaxID=47721 RepID=A0A9P3UNE0_LYOSH|nr:hypothetical protein LshimejAT787_0700880 [Lyophyllum shimeji]